MTDLYNHLRLWTDLQDKPIDRPLIVMLSGAQGIGKSNAVAQLVSEYPGIVSLALDDFYLARAERLRLASDVHKLFATRGPPGTHDLALLNATLDRLHDAEENDQTPIPVFSKRLDDRLPENDWRIWKGRPRIILLEGWMIGALPDGHAPEDAPMNAVEAEDPNGIWRDFQENCLRTDYARLWDRADAFCHIRAPSFEAVLNWRLQQETQNQGVAPGQLSSERADWVRRFILHYERLTRRMLNGHHRPGQVVVVDETRHVIC